MTQKDKKLQEYAAIALGMCGSDAEALVKYIARIKDLTKEDAIKVAVVVTTTVLQHNLKEKKNVTKDNN